MAHSTPCCRKHSDILMRDIGLSSSSTRRRPRRDPSISSKGSTAGALEMLCPHGAALLLPPSSTFPHPPSPAVLRTQVFSRFLPQLMHLLVGGSLMGLLCLLHDVPCLQELLRAQPSTQGVSRGGEARTRLTHLPLGLGHREQLCCSEIIKRQQWVAARQGMHPTACRKKAEF